MMKGVRIVLSSPCSARPSTPPAATLRNSCKCSVLPPPYLISAGRGVRHACRATPESKQVTVADWSLGPSSSDDDAPQTAPQASPQASSEVSSAPEDASPSSAPADAPPAKTAVDLQDLLPPEAALAQVPEVLDLRRAGLGVLNFVIVFVVAFLLPSALPLDMQKSIGLGAIAAYSVTVAAVVAYFTWPSPDVLKTPAASEDDYGL